MTDTPTTTETTKPTEYQAKRRKGKFDDLLAQFVKTKHSAQDYALTLSEMAIDQYAGHGDLSYCQRFHDAMPRNFARRVAFLRWLDAFSPIVVEGGIIKKDRSENATEFNLEGAKAKPFWQFAPDTEQITFTVNDIVTQLKQVVRRNGNDNHKPEDETAAAALKAADAAVKAFEKSVTRSNVA